jgi:hypothetical protein
MHRRRRGRPPSQQHQAVEGVELPEWQGVQAPASPHQAVEGVKVPRWQSRSSVQAPVSLLAAVQEEYAQDMMATPQPFWGHQAPVSSVPGNVSSQIDDIQGSPFASGMQHAGSEFGVYGDSTIPEAAQSPPGKWVEMPDPSLPDALDEGADYAQAGEWGQPPPPQQHQQAGESEWDTDRSQSPSASSDDVNDLTRRRGESRQKHAARLHKDHGYDGNQIKEEFGYSRNVITRAGVVTLTRKNQVPEDIAEHVTNEQRANWHTYSAGERNTINTRIKRQQRMGNYSNSHKKSSEASHPQHDPRTEQATPEPTDAGFAMLPAAQYLESQSYSALPPGGHGSHYGSGFNDSHGQTQGGVPGGTAAPNPLVPVSEWDEQVPFSVLAPESWSVYDAQAPEPWSVYGGQASEPGQPVYGRKIPTWRSSDLMDQPHVQGGAVSGVSRKNAPVKAMVETGLYTRQEVQTRHSGLNKSRVDHFFQEAPEAKRQAPLAEAMAKTGQYTFDEVQAAYPTAGKIWLQGLIKRAPSRWYRSRDGSALMDGQTTLTVDLLAGPNRRVKDFDKEQLQFPLEYNYAKEGEEAKWRWYTNPDGTPAGISVDRLTGLADNREERDALSAAGSALREYKIRSEASGGHSKEDAINIAKATGYIQASYQDKKSTGITPALHPELQKLLQGPRAAAIQEGIEFMLDVNSNSPNPFLAEIAQGEGALFLEYRKQANRSSQAASTQQNIEIFRSRLPSEMASSTDLVGTWNQNYAPAQAGGTFSSAVYYPAASQSTELSLPLPLSMRPGGEYYEGGQMDSSGRMAGSSNVGGAYVPPGMSGFSSGATAEAGSGFVGSMTSSYPTAQQSGRSAGQSYFPPPTYYSEPASTSRTASAAYSVAPASSSSYTTPGPPGGSNTDWRATAYSTSAIPITHTAAEQYPSGRQYASAAGLPSAAPGQFGGSGAASQGAPTHYVEQRTLYNPATREFAGNVGSNDYPAQTEYAQEPRPSGAQPPLERPPSRNYTVQESGRTRTAYMNRDGQTWYTDVLAEADVTRQPGASQGPSHTSNNRRRGGRHQG